MVNKRSVACFEESFLSLPNTRTVTRTSCFPPSDVYLKRVNSPFLSNPHLLFFPPLLPTRPTMFSLRAAQRIGSKVTPCSQRCLSTLGRSSKSPLPSLRPYIGFSTPTLFSRSCFVFPTIHSGSTPTFAIPFSPSPLHHNDSHHLADPRSLPEISFSIFFSRSHMVSTCNTLSFFIPELIL